MNNKKKILVSACLLGVSCRYDGKSKPNEEIIALSDKYEFVSVCPETDGGLPTPRTPSERIGELVVMKDGRDVTENYRRGAENALEICKMNNIDTAILKARSPSCGSGKIYDGSFTGRLIDGDGVTAVLLKSNGITVLTEEDFAKLV